MKGGGKPKMLMTATEILADISRKPRQVAPIHPHRITGDHAVEMHIRRQGSAKVKESRYSGEALRRIRAEKGCGRPPKDGANG